MARAIFRNQLDAPALGPHMRNHDFANWPFLAAQPEMHSDLPHLKPNF